MAKVTTGRARGASKEAEDPDHLTMRLFDPGMTAMHRAGLGGLASTLRYIEQAYQQGRIQAHEAPGGPWDEDRPPWVVETDSITLRFGRPEAAREYFRRLFAMAFQLNDGLIYLPGQYAQPANQAIRADLQLGLALTFLQHGKTRSLAKDSTTVSHDPEGTGLPSITVEYRECSGYKHQNGWQDCVDVRRGNLSRAIVGIEGPLNPGAVVRHNAFSGPTKISESVDRLIPLYFALIGTVALPINRGVGVLLVPDVEDLVQFAIARPFMTPRSSRECQVAGAADAGLQLQVRMKARHLGLPACQAITLRPTPWASQQKSRVQSLYVPALRGRDLDVFELALARLAPRIVIRTAKTTTGKVKAKVTKEDQKAFRTDSVVRPLIAENLTRGRRGTLILD